MPEKKGWLLLALLLLGVSFGAGYRLAPEPGEGTRPAGPIRRPPGFTACATGPFPEPLLAGPERIVFLEQAARESAGRYPVLDLPEARAGEILRERSRWPETARFHPSGEPVSPETIARIRENADGAHRVRYPARTRVRTDMRALPDGEAFLSAPGGHPFDRMQLTAVYPLEPLLVLAESRNGAWLLVLSDHYYGWVPEAAVEPLEEEALEAWISRTPAVVITAPLLPAPPASPGGEEVLELVLGTRIPLATAEERDTAGLAGEAEGSLVAVPFGGGRTVLYSLPAGGAVRERLPLNVPALTGQLEAVLGTPYSWGGAQDGWDCSSLVRDIYRVFGIWLPRDSRDQQEYLQGLPGYTPLDPRMPPAERDAVLAGLGPGSLVFLPGHVVLVETPGEVPGIVHAATSYREPREDGTWRWVDAMQVERNTLEIANGAGIPYRDLATGVFDPKGER